MTSFHLQAQIFSRLTAMVDVDLEFLINVHALIEVNTPGT